MAVVNGSFPYFNLTNTNGGSGRTSVPSSLKDFTKPLHVDCSVEYELPNSAKPPIGTKNEPLLMIHPSYYRREESQNRSPFVNNLPQRITNYMSSGGGGSQNTSRQRSQMRALAAAAAAAAAYSQPSNAKTSQQITKSTGRPSLICSSNEAVNCNTDRGIFRRSPLTAATNSADLTLHSDIQTAPDARFLTAIKDNKSFITDILPSVCQEVNNNSSVSAKAAGNATSVVSTISRKQRSMMGIANHQPQPAVGVAAVAPSSAAVCAGCNRCLAGEPCSSNYVLSSSASAAQHHRHRMQQQPWSGMTAPQFASFPTTSGGKFRKSTLDSPAIAAPPVTVASNSSMTLTQKRTTPWPPNETNMNAAVAPKRSKFSTTASNDKPTANNAATAAAAATTHLYSASAAAANFTQWCNNILPNYSASATATNSATTTAGAVGTGSAADCCKVCQQQQWNYTSHCRAASAANTASSIIWNNENMLRLFQV